jgi:hypothetical protein
VAQEVKTLTWCDIHLQEKDETEPGQSWTLTLTPPGERAYTRTVDVCPACEDPLDAVVQLLAEYGRKSGRGPYKARTSSPEPGAPAAVDGVFTCPECGRESASPQGLGSHRKRAHGVAGTSKDAVRRARAE